MSEQNDGRSSLVENLAQGGHDALDAGRIADLAIFNWHVEIDAQDDPLASEIEVIDGAKPGHQLLTVYLLPVWEKVAKSHNESRSG